MQTGEKQKKNKKKWKKQTIKRETRNKEQIENCTTEHRQKQGVCEQNNDKGTHTKTKGGDK